MNGRRISFVAMVLVCGLCAGLAHAQDAEIHGPVTVGSPVGVPVFSQRVPAQGFPIPAARPVPVRAHAAVPSAVYPPGSRCRWQRQSIRPP